MADNDRAGIHLGFYSKALKDDTRPLSLLGVEGREEISRLFEFDLLLYRRGEPLEDEQLVALVTEPCVVALGSRKSDVVHGVLSHIEHVGGARNKGNYYRARLVPYVSLLSLGRRSAIYQDTNIPDMVTSILTSYGLSQGKSFDMRVNEQGKSPKHEYVVQYEESDWDFIQRWLEREGFFYWFTHAATGVVLVLADANGDATPIESPAKIGFREKNTMSSGGDASIWNFRVRQQRVPAQVTLVDYNYRRPLDMLISSKKVDDHGFGHVFLYGDHFKDPDVGGLWARIRSEELASDKHTVSGMTDCARMRVGYSFELENHYHGAYDIQYLVTALEVSAGVPTNFADFDADHQPAPRPYQAKFRAQPLDVPFRPKRRTAWPKIYGFVSGHVDADTSGDYAQIDDKGRYKVKMTWDVGTHKGLASSRWIRMAQNYAGSGYGNHKPLHKGTEVLIAHTDGDPDRPVIVGAVPNFVTPSPVVSGNASQSVNLTASGIRVEQEDLQK
ncbi:MAG: type VI secretion system tip protein TssI/VgrG [Polyangiaceae bacterium]